LNWQNSLLHCVLCALLSYVANFGTVVEHSFLHKYIPYPGTYTNFNIFSYLNKLPFCVTKKVSTYSLNFRALSVSLRSL